ncbi:peroxisomal membrane protein 11C isoform X2 [Homo sapiens]|uniref:peroxisomal membrane protein 11C isoform X2 n=1 Tax=Homo sapiens TaxID=9606 RepID=UPI000387CF2A|nr:peroxisomal membrane protein 11C isoform X2 [Homo sapiens]XP_054178597.1 peroxisomal membrane protein 11C isoform X2 [Homo sapiens]|eukprot:XP_005272563.1 peroxisomal membrane protein 11C isoform X2 [Homo sapiens]
MASLSGLASALESYRGRDRLIRVLGYCCQLVGGVLVEQCPARSEVGTRLLVVSTQLSHCRTILRLFDDLAMFVYTKQYGLGAQEEDAFVRCVSVLGNLADQLYYPCEHVAWAADARVLHVDSSRWWTLSTTLWALSLLLGVASPLPRGKRRAMEAQMQSEALSLLSNLADLANAVHWLPRGVLWAGRFPPWLVGLMGTISSILSMYQAARAGGQAEATTP